MKSGVSTLSNVAEVTVVISHTDINEVPGCINGWHTGGCLVEESGMAKADKDTVGGADGGLSSPEHQGMHSKHEGQLAGDLDD